MTTSMPSHKKPSHDRFQKKFSYHHGDLRAALLDAALDLLKQDGATHLSLRALAKKTGVTQAAPYSHFRDKEDLLAAVAEAGFQRLALKMAATATGAKNVRARIESLMTAYITFAKDNTALFNIMFGREVADMKKYPTLAMTAGKSYALISSTLMQREEPQDTPFLTAAVWSLCHGLTGLIIEGRLDPAQFGAEDTAALVHKTANLFSQKLG